jgi:hypothetical protein
MKPNTIILLSSVIIVFIIYLIYTIRYAITFSKNTIFEGKRKKLHSILIWIIPFAWIMLLKSILKRTPGSHEFQDKKDMEGFVDNTSSWVGVASQVQNNSGGK